MLLIEVTLPDPTPTVEVIAARMRQQIVDAHTAAVVADDDEADDVVFFITETYTNLMKYHGGE